MEGVHVHLDPRLQKFGSLLTDISEREYPELIQKGPIAWRICQSHQNRDEKWNEVFRGSFQENCSFKCFGERCVMFCTFSFPLKQRSRWTQKHIQFCFCFIKLKRSFLQTELSSYLKVAYIHKNINVSFQFVDWTLRIFTFNLSDTFP